MKRNDRRASILIGLALLPVTAGAWNWADEASAITQDAEFAHSKAICRDLRGLEPPAADRPDAAPKRSLAGCDSADLYYGIGGPRQPERARECAFVEAAGDDGDDRPFAGTSMLMMIYANGVGAARDLDLATSLACRVLGAPAEVGGRVEHLQRLKSQDWQGHDFDYCDDITSGMAGGLCAARDAGIADAKRVARLDRLSQGWPADERQAFAALRTAEQAYAQASADNEVDLSGTARAALEIQQAQHLHQVFDQLLDRLEAGGLPHGTAAGHAAAGTRLNTVYRRIMAIETPPDERGVYGSADSLPWTTVTHRGIRDTERAWLHYRDAWVAFAAARYPTLDADALRTVLTRQRIAQLTPFLPEPPPEKPASPPVTFQKLPADAAPLLERARGIVAGGDAQAEPVFQVIFDVNAPSDAALWHNLKEQYPDIAVRWLPVAYFGRDSGPVAATMLAADDPAAALASNFQGYNKTAHKGALNPAPGARLGAPQKRLREAWTHWGGYTPMLIVKNADGTFSQTGGANGYVIDAVIARARAATPENDD